LNIKTPAIFSKDVLLHANSIKFPGFDFKEKTLRKKNFLIDYEPRIKASFVKELG